MRSKNSKVDFALAALFALAGAAAAAQACSSDQQASGTSQATGPGSGGSSQSSASAAQGGAGGGVSTSSGGSTSGGGGGVVSNYPCDGCDPFPKLGAKECDPQALAPPTVVYPTDGILVPPNMNVLEVQFLPPSGATLFEVDFTNAATQVTVETKCVPVPEVRDPKGPGKGCGITLTQKQWNDVANINRDGEPLKVTVRATKDGSCVATSQSKIAILFAKDDLVGGIYYWQSAVYGGLGGKTGGIFRHDFGTFDPKPTPFLTAGSNGTCVGCHNLSRDGVSMTVGFDDPDADDEMGDLKTSMISVATKTPVAGTAVSPGFQTWTHDHTRLVASTFKSHADGAFDVFDGNGKLVKSNVLGNMVAATQPDLGKDDKVLVYVVPQAKTISNFGDHHFFGGAIYSSTFDATSGVLGAPTLVLAPSGTESYYYPALSPDEKFLVFDHAPDGDAFWNRKAVVQLLHFPPAAKAAPLALPALNASPSLANSWPRWSPFVQSYHGHQLLWVTFSSDRDYGLHLKNAGFDHCYPPESPAYDQPQPLSKQGVGYENCAQPQIWMAAILVDGGAELDGQDRSFPAFWLPFQDVNSHNFSAQWVEKVQDGGGGSGGGGGGSPCGTNGADCVAGGCCAEFLCCGGTCQDPSFCVK